MPRSRDGAAESTANVGDLVVVEFEGSVAGAYATKLLSDQGATVVSLVDRAASTTMAPGSGLGLYLTAGKDVRILADGVSAQGWSAIADGHPEIADLLARADVMVRSSAPDPLEPSEFIADLRRSNPSAISVEISPLGSVGPWASRRSTDLTDQALSGHLLLNGEPDREPVAGPEHQVGYAAGAHAAIGVLAAVMARLSTGRGQRVEVSHQEVMVALHQFTLLRYTHAGDVLRRMGNRYAGPGRPIGAYRCGDRMISLVVPRDDQLDRLLGVAGLDHLLDEPGIGSTYDLMHHPTLLDEHLRPWLAAQDHDETIELLQALRVPAGPVNSMADLLADEQLTHRNYWPSVEHDGQSLLMPGRPFTIVPASVEARPAPTADRPDARRPDGDRPDSENEADEANPVSGPDLLDGPLTGIRVLDLTRVWAGPLATRILADLGAEVIMIEAPWARGPAGIDISSVMATRYYPDDDPGDRHWNRVGFLNKYAINKKSVALDLSRPAGREAFESLIGDSDVVIENYSPRVMPQLGLSEDRLHQLNPSLVYVTMPGFGRSGPAVDRVAYGPMIDSHAGLSVLQGYSDDVARKGGVAWPDPVAGLHAAFATLVALSARAVDPDRRGSTIEAAQLEATVAVVGHALLDAQLSGREPHRIGNRHSIHSPQGVYRCQGDDRWLALSVTDDAGWAGLCRAANLDSGWASWSADERCQQHDRIDRAVESWTVTGQADELADLLQAAGVAAAAVADAPMVMADPHLAARGYFVAFDHPEAGTHEWPRLAIGLDDTPASYRCPAPTLNQHGDAILADLGGLTDAEIAELRAAAILSDRPPE